MLALVKAASPDRIERLVEAKLGELRHEVALAKLQVVSEGNTTMAGKLYADLAARRPCLAAS